MDQKRLPLFIAISAAILIAFQWLLPHKNPPQLAQQAAQVSKSTPSNHAPAPTFNPAPPGTQPVHVPPPSDVPRVKIDAPRVVGSVSLIGARLDDLRLRDYHETVSKSSPLVRVLEPESDPQPSYVQFGWSADQSTKTPGDDTLWTSSGGAVSVDHPVTLSWNNGAGLLYSIALSIDANYEFHVAQSVHDTGTAGAKVWPWERIRRDYLPASGGYSVFEGLLGVMDDRLKTISYASTKSAADKHDGVAYDHTGDTGWAGFTDKYWLTAMIPDQGVSMQTSWNHWLDDAADRFQVSYTATDPLSIAPGGTQSFGSRVFVGAKEVHLLDRYQTSEKIPLLSYAVDWGKYLFFLTKPFFYTIDWLYSVVGNFGVAILIFTMGVKLLFYPIAARAYSSMGKMRLLAPKITAVRERYKDEPAKLQSEMMAVYKAEGVNPVGGCLPMVIQIPVFFALYSVILVTIEMRHAPFFGWVQDLSATDPTNIFNLFGVIPFDPTLISPFLHLGIWPLVMGATMFFQQKLNPPPPDPMQARLFQFMPLIFMFTMGRFPAGLVIYWSWNNTLTIAQQWYIQRNAKLAGPKAKK